MIHNHLVVERAKEGNLRLPCNLEMNVRKVFFKCRLNNDLYPVKIVVEGVDDNEDITKLGGDDSPSIVSPVFRPDNVDLIIAKMSCLGQHALVAVARHPGRHVEHDLQEAGGVVGRGLPRHAPRPGQPSHEPGVRLQLHLPAQTRHKLFESLGSTRV